MPIYEYRCEACGDREEKLQGLSAPEQHDCPACGAQEGMRRQISRAAFALAGGGWYAQGYGAGSPAAPAKAEAKAEPAPAKPSGGCGGGCACH